MKGIGIFVLLLVAGLGVGMYFATRPPDRSLDANGRAWVASFTTWRANLTREANRAYVRTGFTSQSTNSRLLGPLRRCSAGYARLGDPPKLLQVVSQDMATACREAEYAVSVNDRFGLPALATSKQHLKRAQEWLALAARDLHDQLGANGA